MERSSQKIGLDNPVFRGRLRAPLADRKPAIRARPHAAQNTRLQGRPKVDARASIRTNTALSHKEAKKRRTMGYAANVAIRQSVLMADKKTSQPFRSRAASILAQCRSLLEPKLALQIMAVVVFVIGLSVSLRTEHVNRQANAKVEALSQQESGANQDSGSSDAPSTKKPSNRAMTNYVVAPDLPRYIAISKLGVKARVLQMGVKADGALEAPRNVYDAGWYTGSAKPGQQGATVIDGHVSGWRTKGVFYGLKTLKKDDTITITRGDGVVLTYKVKHHQTYKANAVDMQKVITPITQGKPGLNLITCAGKVKPGTNDFTHRTVIFAEQI